MVIRKFVAVVILLVLVSAGHALAAITFVSAVKDAAGQPVAGAVVETSTGATAVTDADGAFRMEGLPEGVLFSMKASKAGYVDAWWPEQQSTTDILIPTRYMTLYTAAEAAELGALPGKGLIRGRTRDIIGDEPIEGVTVTAVNAMDTSVSYPVIVSGSSYRIVGLEDGAAVAVYAVKDGWSFPSRLCFARADSVVSSSFRGRKLSYPNQTVNGAVVDENGAPVSGATVTVSAVPSAKVSTASDGKFTIYDIPGGLEYYLVIAKDGFATTYSANMASTTSQVGVNTYSLHPLSSLAQWGVEPGKGVVRSLVSRTGETPDSIENAVVSVSSYLHPSNPPAVSYPGSATGATATTGRYLIANAEEGDLLTVTAAKEGWSFKARTFLVHRDGLLQGRVWGTPETSTAGCLSVTPNPVDFGQVGIGFSSPPVKVTYRNPCAGPVTLLSASGSKGDVERVAGTCPQTLPITIQSGGSCTASYVFTPTDAGDRGGEVTLTTDSPQTPTVREVYRAVGYMIPPPQLSLRKDSASFGYKGGKGTISLVGAGTGSQSLSWTASTEATWISLPVKAGTMSIRKGKGSGAVHFSVAPNPAATPRTATVKVSGEDFTVTQAAAPCKIGKIEPGNLLVGPQQLTTTVHVSLPEGCSLEVAEQSPWLTATAAGSDIGVTIDPNPTGKARTAKITLTTSDASRTYTVSQKK